MLTIMRNRYCFLLLCTLILSMSCSTTKIASNVISKSCGKLSFTKRVYDSTANVMNTVRYQQDPLIYYRDSLIVEETFRVEIETDIFGNKIGQIYPWEITFIDLPSRNFYVFSSFSDTAILIRKYTQADSIKGNLANFWGLPSSFNDSEIKRQRDTVIDNIRYEMFQKVEYVLDISRSKDPLPVYSVAYLTCDTNKPPIMTLDKGLSEKHKFCPVKRTDRFVIGEGVRLVTEIQYLSDTLTLKEEKIFNAWAKYAKEHPVEK